jgi:hypothetical protein
MMMMIIIIIKDRITQQEICNRTTGRPARLRIMPDQLPP